MNSGIKETVIESKVVTRLPRPSRDAVFDIFQNFKGRKTKITFSDKHWLRAKNYLHCRPYMKDLSSCSYFDPVDNIKEALKRNMWPFKWDPLTSLDVKNTSDPDACVRFLCENLDCLVLNEFSKCCENGWDDTGFDWLDLDDLPPIDKNKPQSYEVNDCVFTRFPNCKNWCAFNSKFYSSSGPRRCRTIQWKIHPRVSRNYDKSLQIRFNNSKGIWNSFGQVPRSPPSFVGTTRKRNQTSSTA